MMADTLAAVAYAAFVAAGSLGLLKLARWPAS